MGLCIACTQAFVDMHHVPAAAMLSAGSSRYNGMDCVEGLLHGLYPCIQQTAWLQTISASAD